MKQQMLARRPHEDQIPEELAKLVGLITIRFGQLERTLMNVYCRILEPQQDLLGIIAALRKKFKTLTKRVEHIEKEFGKRQILPPTWLDFPSLKNLAKERNAIHDALLINEESYFCWLPSSHERAPRQANLIDLRRLLDQLTEALLQLNTNSLAEKQSIGGEPVN